MEETPDLMDGPTPNQHEAFTAGVIFQLIDQVEHLQCVILELQDRVSRMAGSLETAKATRGWLKELVGGPERNGRS